MWRTRDGSASLFIDVGACVVGDQNLCKRHSCSTSRDCAYGKLCINADCCGSHAQVCMPLCQD